MATKTSGLLILGYLATSAGLVLPVPSNLASSANARAPRVVDSLFMTASPSPTRKRSRPVVDSELYSVQAPQTGGWNSGITTGRRRERTDGKSDNFEVNLGKVIETLRRDYPRLFSEPPSFDIYDPEIELRDPTGVAFRGIGNYKRVFATLRFFRQLLMKDASTTFRINYDWSKQQVRVTWNMVLALKARHRPIYVDGISSYHINSEGLAYRHELETVVVNGTPVEPPFAYAWINLPAWVSTPRSGGALEPAAIPAPSGFIVHPFDRPELEGDVGGLLNALQANPILREDLDMALTVLAASEQMDSPSGMDTTASSDERENLNEEPGSSHAQKAEKKEKRKIREKKKKGWFGLEGPQECETSFDCTGGMVCCDFMLVKVCCSNGIRQPIGDLAPALIPVPTRDDGGYGRRRPNSW